MTRERAYRLRELIEKAAESLEDADALDAVEFFPAWAEGIEYAVGDRVRHEDTLYKCLQAHTSQAQWTPDVAPSLWAVVLIPDPEVIPDWVQPDATNAYMTGDKVRFEGHVYVSLIDNNVWSPTAYPAGWQIVE
jgi:chitodextrinase